MKNSPKEHPEKPEPPKYQLETYKTPQIYLFTAHFVIASIVILIPPMAVAALCAIYYLEPNLLYYQNWKFEYQLTAITYGITMVYKMLTSE